MKLFVAGLPYDMFDEELVEIFEKFGPLVSAKVALDKETGKSRGFAFVEMQNDQDGRDAIEHLSDIAFGKKQLVVKEAEDRSAQNRGNSTTPRRDNRGGRGDNRGGYGGGGYNNDRNSNDRNRY